MTGGTTEERLGHAGHAAPGVVVCGFCDAVTRRVALRRGERACCPCCGEALYRPPRLTPDATLALALAGVVALVIANLYPVMTMQSGGMRGSVTFWQSVLVLNDGGFIAVAAVVAVTGLVAPAVQLGLLVYVCAALRLGVRAPGSTRALHLLRHVRSWSMIEVLLMGALVATVKLAGMAKIAPGVGLFALLALALCVAVLTADDPDRLWGWLDEVPRRVGP